MSRVKDMTGLRFGRLTVMETAGVAKNRKVKWRCACDCDGKIIEVESGNLRRGQSTSCGCRQKEVATKRAESERQDLTGMVFGRLTVIGLDPDKKKYSGCCAWICECACDGDRKPSIQTKNLLGGVSKSCGCVAKEKRDLHNLLVSQYTYYARQWAQCDVLYREGRIDLDGNLIHLEPEANTEQPANRESNAKVYRRSNGPVSFYRPWSETALETAA